MLGTADVTIITATIPTRADLLARAVASVKVQTLQPAAHLIMEDTEKIGGAAVLDKLLKKVRTKYVAVLDDDDELLPRHIEAIYTSITESDADLVYPWFRYQTSGNAGHLERYFGVAWSNDDVHQVPITWIAKTLTIKRAGGFSEGYITESMDLDSGGNRIGYDFILIQRLVAHDRIIKHHPEITWVYHDDRQSTLGMPSRW
jgi:glycosyltransferase involved in cell wall biosynthesis